ncbi:Protein unc-79 [Dermatophagoides pteronyssinus]|uniref:Protein unc-79 n=1 Tax=Dermatophagoides pteronyssinus TaxID=6956 RepID=A0ABQ8J5X2_DERPT|nr:Protein unc-79 [Dermatophagoides pteronyssinus]
MGTRAASFSAKIRNLQDYHHRLLNGITPYPSIPDIINVLKFFSQALLTILRDVPCIPIDLIRDPNRDSIRIGFFPNLDYRNLFYTLSGMLDSFANIQSTLSSNAPIVFEYLLHALVCLVPFLEHEMMDSMPLTVANTISLNFISHQDIIDMLCYNILPFTLYNKSKENDGFDFAKASIPSILMTVLSHTDSLSLHSQLLECLMRLKSNIIQDLLVVIAYGTGKARHASVELLFQYWPGLNPSALDRKHLSEKHIQWKPLTCQNDTCQNTLNNEAVKICFAQIDLIQSSSQSGGGGGQSGGGGGGGQSGGGGGGGQTAPGMTALPASIDLKGRPPIPLLICIECAESVREQNSLNKSIKSQDILLNVLHPMAEISYTCESKSCLGQQQQQQQQTTTIPSRPLHYHHQQQQQLQPAVVTCFSTECTSFNCNKPVRLCQQCHEQRHGYLIGQSLTPPPPPPTTTTTNIVNQQQQQQPSNIVAASSTTTGRNHLVQEHLRSFWQLPLEAQQHFTEAVVALLREAAANDKSSKEGERYMRTHGTGAYTGAMSSSLGADRMTGSGGGMGGVSGGQGVSSGQSNIGSGGQDVTGSGQGGGGTAGGVGGSNIGSSDRGRDGGGGGAGGGQGTTGDSNDSSIEERQLLSRYGIWLLIGLVDPAEANTNERIELLGRMLAMLCQWFHNTACLPDDQAGSALERIKSESIHGWLMKVIESQFCLFANCLVPSPPDHAQIGGHWECWPSMTNQIKEGFKRLLCLVPYDIITPDIWSYIMPFWMESFRYDLAEDELSELKILLSKVLDPDLSPLGLEADDMYRFISRSFDQQLPGEQEQALSWLQILTLLEIPVPMYLLEQMFLAGIKSFHSLREMCIQQQQQQKLDQDSKQQQQQTTKEDQQQQQQQEGQQQQSSTTTATLTPPQQQQPEIIPQSASMSILPSTISMENIQQSELSCYVLMLDIIVKQFEYLPDQPGHKGFNDQQTNPRKIYQPLTLAKMSKSDSDFGFNTLVILYEMINTTECTSGPHTCHSSLQRPPDTSQMFKPDSVLTECFFCELCSIWYQLTLQIITLYSPIIELTVIPDLADQHMEHETINTFAKLTKRNGLLFSLNGDNNGQQQDQDEDEDDKDDQEDDDNIDESEWIKQLTLSERLTLKLLQEIPVHSDPDVLYHLLQCLKLLTLHCGVFVQMAKHEQKREFFLRCQRKYLVISLWRLLQAEFSQISQIAVPLLLHCIALPGGLAVLVRTINSEFRSTDWCIRFAAIERVATFSQFIDQSSMKNSPSIQSALSSLFIHLIQTLDDINSAVAQRSLTALELMRAASLKIYVMCLEMQFDLVIVDRCLVLSSLLQLFNHLNERRILTWEFFLNRFDAIFVEAQVLPTATAAAAATGTSAATLRNNNVDVIATATGTATANAIESGTRDLRNTNIHSETYKKKIIRAQEALGHIHLKRSLLPHHFSGRNEQRHLLSVAEFFTQALRSSTAVTRNNDFNQQQQAETTGENIDTSSTINTGQQQQQVSSKSNLFTKLHSHHSQTQLQLPQNSSMQIHQTNSSINLGNLGPSSSTAMVGGTGASTSSGGGAVSRSHHSHRSEKLKNLSASNQAAINRKSSKLAALTGSAFPNNFFQDQGQTKQDMAQEELMLFNVVHRQLDDNNIGGSGGEYCDQETLHLLVFLFMQFLSYPDPQHPIDDKSLNRTQIIVLRHLNTLLGYSMSENIFLLSAYDLRRKSVFSAFISALPDVLDLNLSVGSLLLSLIFPILLYCPAEHHTIYLSDLDHYQSTYSLWLLSTNLRRSWLNSLIIILYKHQYATSTMNAKFIHHLIQIVQNTLESALEHKCNPNAAAARRRSREQQKESIVVVGGDEQQQPDEELNVMLMLIDKAKELEQQKYKDKQQQQPMIKKEIVKELDEIKVEKVEVYTDHYHQPQQQQQQQQSKPMKKSINKIPDEQSIVMETQTPPPPLPLERLLPVGGELCDAICTSLQRRPLYPSMLQQQQQQQQQSSMDQSNEQQQQQQKPVTTTTTNQPCCCCCAAATGQVCCLNYQQTLDAFRQLPPPPPIRNHSTERLLPIGPRPHHHHHSRSLTGGSRSVERSTSSGPFNYSGKKSGRNRYLIRQHTTIATTTTMLADENLDKRLLSSSKSMDSMDPSLSLSSSSKARLVIAKIRSEPEPELKKSQIILSPTSNSSTPPMMAKEMIVVQQQQQQQQQESSHVTKTIINQKMQKNISPLKSASSPNLNDGPIQQSSSSSSQQQQQSKSIQQQKQQRIPPTQTQTQPSSPTKIESPASLESSISIKTTSLTSTLKPMDKIIKSTSTSTTTTTTTKSSKQQQKKKKKTKNKSSSAIKSLQQQQTSSLVFPSVQQQQQQQSEIDTISPHSFSAPASARPTQQQQQQMSDTMMTDSQTQQPQSQSQSTKEHTGRSNDSTNSDLSYHQQQQQQQFELCNCCDMPIEKFDEHELGLCLVALATFVHRNPTLAAPTLPQILKLTSRYALRCVFPWQMESNIHLPGNTASIARQFIRCTLHQLNSNGIFRQIFQTHSGDIIMFRSIAISLADFVELNQVTPLKELFEALTDDKQLPPLSQILLTLSNVATYFECVFVDYNVTQSCSLSTLSPIISSQYGANVPVMGASIVANQPWSDLMTPLENYLRRLSFNLIDIAPNIHNLVPLMRVLLALFKIPGIGAHRSILDPVTKILAHIFQHSPILLEHVRDLCIHCNRAYVRDRDRFCIARTFAQELVQALRFRTQAPDENIFALVQWALEDAGGSLPYSIAVQSLERNQNRQLGLTGITVELPTTNATECLRCFIPELLEFIGDLHALAKLRSNFQGTSIHINQETLGGNLKAGISQFLALELTRLSGSDAKAITKYLPWLYSLPSIQNGPKEFSECISHVRLLSWILLGSLQHTALMKCHPSQSSLLVSQPIPLDVSNHVAEHIHVILAGFGSESKSSVVHMSALFYAFLLCQLWTVYCEQLASQNPPGSDAAHQNILVLTDFWTKVTPGILQIISHSMTEIPQLADTITLHFLSLIETLMECNSEILARLLPLWLPFFNSYPGQLSDHVSARLKTLISWPVPAQTKNDAMMLSTVLIRWLQRIQARMSQIEIQSSTVTQFYCV